MPHMFEHFVQIENRENRFNYLCMYNIMRFESIFKKRLKADCGSFSSFFWGDDFEATKQIV